MDSSQEIPTEGWTQLQNSHPLLIKIPKCQLSYLSVLIFHIFTQTQLFPFGIQPISPQSGTITPRRGRGRGWLPTNLLLVISESSRLQPSSHPFHTGKPPPDALGLSRDWSEIRFPKSICQDSTPGVYGSLLFHHEHHPPYSPRQSINNWVL